MIIVADENIEDLLINEIRNSGFNVVSVKENYRGFDDNQVVQLVRKKNAMRPLLKVHLLPNSSLLYLYYSLRHMPENQSQFL